MTRQERARFAALTDRVVRGAMLLQAAPGAQLPTDLDISVRVGRELVHIVAVSAHWRARIAMSIPHEHITSGAAVLGIRHLGVVGGR